MGRNIILTGFMGTGKSSVGQVLAERLSMNFYDTDIEIEKQYGPIEQIFHSLGESVFRGYEREIAHIVSEFTNTVIATGGGFMVDQENADLLSSSGRVFCLTASIEEILERLTDQSEVAARPLLHSEDSVAAISALLVERKGVYGEFEQVKTDGKTLEEVAGEISSRLVKSELS